MSDTLEYDAYEFFDWFAWAPHDGLQEAFEKAGGRVVSDEGSIIVRGLAFEEAKEIARVYQADYIGPVFSRSCEKIPMKDITPVKVNLRIGRP